MRLCRKVWMHTVQIEAKDSIFGWLRGRGGSVTHHAAYANTINLTYFGIQT